MAKKIIKLWYDKEGDYLEVSFEKKADSSARPRMMQLWKKLTIKGMFLGFPFACQQACSKTVASVVDLMETFKLGDTILNSRQVMCPLNFKP